MKRNLTLSLILTLALLLFSTIPAYAQSIPLADSLTIIDPSEVPEGITPMVFETQEQANAYVAELSEAVRKSNAEARLARMQAELREASPLSFSIAAVDKYNGTLTQQKNIGGQVFKLEARVYFEYFYSGSNPRFSSVTGHDTYFVGATATDSWEELNAYSQILDSQRSLGLSVDGLWHMYIYIPGSGLTETYTQTVEEYFEWGYGAI